MKIINNILVLSNKQTNKEYSQIVSGMNIIDHNKTIPILHKKTIKEIDFKELWNNMSLFYIKETLTNKDKDKYKKLDPNGINFATTFFQWFNEETWQQYNFYPKTNTKKLEEIEKNFKSLNINTQNSNKTTSLTSNTEYISFLFISALLYWKFTINNEDLKSTKIHFPLFGQYLNKNDIFEKIQKELQNTWYFIQTKTTKTKDGIIQEITITDYEILQIFANFLKPIAKITKISKYDFSEKTKQLLLEKYPETKTLITNKTIKLLTK